MILISRPDNRGSKKSGGLADRNRTLIPELLQNRSLWKSRSLTSQTAAWRSNFSYSLKGNPVKMKYQGATKWQGWGLSQGCLAPPEPWLMSSCLRNCCTQSQGPEHRKWDVLVGLKMFRELRRHGRFLDWRERCLAEEPRLIFHRSLHHPLYLWCTFHFRQRWRDAFSAHHFMGLLHSPSKLGNREGGEGLGQFVLPFLPWGRKPLIWREAHVGHRFLIL